MKTIKLIIVVLVALFVPSLALGEDLVLGHRPPPAAKADTALTIAFTLNASGRFAAANVHYRPIGAKAWQAAPIKLSSSGAWQAQIPADAIDDPGLEYYVESTDIDGGKAAQFASPEVPHTVLVRGDPMRIRERETLAELGGLRSELQLQAGWTDYRTAGPTAGTDKDTGPRYSDFSARYRYWLLRGVEHLEFGVGRLDGIAESSDNLLVPPLPAVHTGFQRGWTQIGLRATDQLGLAMRLTLGADELGFRLGLAGVMRLGAPRRTRFELDVGATGGVGWHVLSSFHLATVPKIPVAFEVLLTNGPNEGHSASELVRLRLGYQLNPGLVIGSMLSYQALTGPDHGLGAGVELAFRF